MIAPKCAASWSSTSPAGALASYSFVMVTPTRIIDLNADLGESYGNWRMGDDVAMLEIVSSANIPADFTPAMRRPFAKPSARRQIAGSR